MTFKTILASGNVSITNINILFKIEDAADILVLEAEYADFSCAVSFGNKDSYANDFNVTIYRDITFRDTTSVYPTVLFNITYGDFTLADNAAFDADGKPITIEAQRLVVTSTRESKDALTINTSPNSDVIISELRAEANTLRFMGCNVQLTPISTTTEAINEWIHIDGDTDVHISYLTQAEDTRDHLASLYIGLGSKVDIMAYNRIAVQNTFVAKRDPVADDSVELKCSDDAFWQLVLSRVSSFTFISRDTDSWKTMPTEGVEAIESTDENDWCALNFNSSLLFVGLSTKIQLQARTFKGMDVVDIWGVLSTGLDGETMRDTFELSTDKLTLRPSAQFIGIMESEDTSCGGGIPAAGGGSCFGAGSIPDGSSPEMPSECDDKLAILKEHNDRQLRGAEGGRHANDMTNTKGQPGLSYSFTADTSHIDGVINADGVSNTCGQTGSDTETAYTCGGAGSGGFVSFSCDNQESCTFSGSGLVTARGGPASFPDDSYTGTVDGLGGAGGGGGVTFYDMKRSNLGDVDSFRISVAGGTTQDSAQVKQGDSGIVFSAMCGKNALIRRMSQSSLDCEFTPLVKWVLLGLLGLALVQGIYMAAVTVRNKVVDESERKMSLNPLRFRDHKLSGALGSGRDLNIVHLAAKEGWFIETDDLEYGDFIGKGGAAQVFKGTYKGTPVAIKRIAVDLRNEQALRDITREALLMSRLRHPHCLAFYGAHFTESEAVLVMELAAAGDFRRFVDSFFAKYKVPTAKYVVHVCKLLSQVISALQHLHAQRPMIVHRDLKPGNILMRSLTSAVLADFGISRSLKEEGAATVTMAGTPAYAAPESFQNVVTEKYDIYCIGTILWESMTNRKPFGSIPNPLRIMSELNTVGAPSTLEERVWTRYPDIRDFVARCWTREYSERPTAVECFNVMSGFIERYGDH